MANQNPQPGPFKRDVAHQSAPKQPGLLDEDPITKIILATNVCMFAAMCLTARPSTFIQPDNQTLINWGADYGPLVLRGEIWRPFSAMFVHIGALHIALNMYVLWDVGRAVERLYGSFRFLLVYVFAGLGGALTSLYFHPDLISAGASGAVFGAFGALIVFLKIHARHFVESYVKSATRSIVFLLIFNLFWGMSHPQIDNWAHVGGFITGGILGICVSPLSPTQNKWTVKNSILLIIFCLCFSLFAFINWQALHKLH